MSDSKKPQPASYRLLAADELGVLRGEQFNCKSSSMLTLNLQLQTCRVYCLVDSLPSNNPECSAVVEVPAGPKWSDAALVQKW